MAAFAARLAGPLEQGVDELAQGDALRLGVVGDQRLDHRLVMAEQSGLEGLGDARGVDLIHL
jgi:hypothetical protein